MVKPRIYYDCNHGLEDGRFLLDLSASVEDIARQSQFVHPGAPVILYMDDEDSEIQAVIQFDQALGVWVAEQAGVSKR